MVVLNSICLRLHMEPVLHPVGLGFHRLLGEVVVVVVVRLVGLEVLPVIFDGVEVADLVVMVIVVLWFLVTLMKLVGQVIIFWLIFVGLNW